VFFSLGGGGGGWGGYRGGLALGGVGGGGGVGCFQKNGGGLVHVKRGKITQIGGGGFWSLAAGCKGGAGILTQGGSMPVSEVSCAWEEGNHPLRTSFDRGG